MGFIQGQVAALRSAQEKSDAFDWFAFGEGLLDVFANNDAYGNKLDGLEIVMPARGNDSDRHVIVFTVQRTVREVKPGMYPMRTVTGRRL